MSKGFTFTLRFLLFSLFLYMAMEVVRPNSFTVSTTTISVDPSTSRAEVGQTFMINIKILNVIDLYGWEFKLRWDSSLLEVLNVTEGTFLKGAGNSFFVSKINNTVGDMLVDCSLVGDVSGVSGNGILATVEFHVETRGECILDLYNTKLVSSLEQPITHAAIDGYYYTLIHDVAVIDLAASSTHINVTVENQGTHTETFNISTYYTRQSDPLIGTQTVTLTKGTLATLTFTWTPPSPGRYEILADASIVLGETDVADNVRTIIIQVGYSTSNLGSQTANSPNGFYIIVSLFLFASAMMMPKALHNIKRTQSYLLPNISRHETPSEINIWQHLTIKQLNSLR